MAVVSKVISRNVARSQGNFPKDSNRQNNQSSSTGPGKMNIANAVAQADFFDEKGILKEYTPQNQHTGSMYVLKKFQGNPSSNILFSDNGIEIQHSVSRSRSCSNPYSRFPISRISAHGSNKPISNRLLQHFRYVGFERMQ